MFGKLAYINEISGPENFWIFAIEDIDDKNKPIRIDNTYERLKEFMRKVKGEKVTWTEYAKMRVRFYDIDGKILLDFYPTKLDIKDEIHLYVIELTGKIDYAAGFENDLSDLISIKPFKTRLLIDKNTDLEKIVKFIANYFFCPFIHNSKNLPKHIKASLFVDFLTFPLPKNKLSIFEGIKDKYLSEFIIEILGLNDLAKMLKWRKRKDSFLIHEKITDIANRIVKVGQYITIDEIIEPEYVKPY